MFLLAMEPSTGDKQQGHGGQSLPPTVGLSPNRRKNRLDVAADRAFGFTKG